MTLRLKILAPERGQDKHGAGHFGAPRGSRTHNGIDTACHEGSIVLAAAPGIVTKIGRPYYDEGNARGRNHLRYIETRNDDTFVRYFYVKPHMLQVGDTVLLDEPLGATQGLTRVYPGIIDHFHIEVFTVVDGERQYIDPKEYLR